MYTLPRHGDFALDKGTASDDDALVGLEVEVFGTEREDGATRCAPFSSTLARKARHLARAQRAGHSVSTATEAGGSRASSPPRRQIWKRSLKVKLRSVAEATCKGTLTLTLKNIAQRDWRFMRNATFAARPRGVAIPIYPGCKPHS